MTTHIYRIGDIHCIGCINRITFALESVGASHVDIDLSTHIAKVITRETQTDEKVFLQAIVETGYKAEYLTTVKED